MPDIRVAGLVKTYGNTRALDGVSFDVADKELFTLLGPSGCGKSTTLMSIAGFTKPDSGEIVCGDQTYFDGAANVVLAAEQRNLGIVFQSYALWPHMTVFGNVAFPLQVRKTSRDRMRSAVASALDLLEIGTLAKRYPHELSGGQQQRVALARAIVYSPTVLLLDEPFSNLDAKLRERARVWLKDLQHDLGLTTIFVTHDQDEALCMSDRILVMNEGVVLQKGTPQEIYRQPAHRFVAGFVGQCNLLAGRVAKQSSTGSQIVIEGAPTAIKFPSGLSAVGDSITLALRPESIEFETGERRGGVNIWPVEIVSAEFLGDHYLYRLRAGSLDLVASCRESMVGGGPMFVRIPPEALVDVT